MSARYTGGLVYNPPGGWSGLFNGSNQYLQAADNVAFQLGTGDFTLEAWVNMISVPATNGYYIVAGKYSSTANCYYFQIYNNAGTMQLIIGGATGSVTANYIFAANTWYHLAAVRNGATTSLYVNGISVASGTFADNANASGIPYRIGVIQSTVSSTFLGYFNGYISNNRLVKGTAVYTSNFTPPTAPLQAISGTSILTCRYPTIVDGSTNNFTITNVNTVTVNTANPFPTSVLPNPALGNAGNGIYTMSQYASLFGAGTWPAIDPYYENVVMNLHGNAGAVLPFNTDASTNNFQVTQVGDTRPSNYTPFIENGYWSNYFDGSSYLQVAYNSALDAGTGAFTYEAWLNPSTTTNKQYLGGSVTNAFFAFVGSGTIFVGRNNVAVDFTSSSGILTNQWNHVVIVRNASNNIAIFINGVSAYYNASNTNNYGLASNPLRIGVATTGSSYEYNGYISNVRIAKSALYDPTASTITVPTAPLTAGSAGLLTCQSNRFVDNSTNAFAITTSGTPSINPLQPFTAPTGTSAYGSGYFDGTGDWLNPPTGQTALTLGTSDFTIEMWAYPTTQVRGNPALFTSDPGAGLANTILVQFIGTTGQTILWVNNTNLTASSTTNYIKLNQWNHIAICRSGGSTYTFYINGVAVNNVATNSTSLTTSSWYLGYWTVADNAYTGYLSNFRIVKGTVVYTGAFTPPTSPLTAITNTSLLTVQTNAPSQNNTFLDSSTNNFTITRNGNTTQGTFTPYGSNWSNYFDGSTAWLITGSSVTALGSGNWTVEFWLYPTALGAIQVISDARTSSQGLYPTFYINASNKIILYANTADLLTSTNTVSANVWTHFAFVKNSTTTTCYINGVANGTYSDSNTYLAGITTFGASGLTADSRSAKFTGYISNYRQVVGTAVYTSAFTPSTGPLTAISGTSLLVCKSNRFVDNSTNNNTITPSGSPSVQRFSPFSPPASYSDSTVGGSAYFDGSGDYLSTSGGGATAMGTGDFTWECWVRVPAASAYQTFIDSRSNPAVGTSDGFFFGLNTGTLTPMVFTTSLLASSSISITVNTWNHVAITRSGTTLAFWVNGASGGTLTNSTNLSNPSVYFGGSTAAGVNLTGYLSNIRMVKGTAVYTTAFTPSTTPLTAIANTSLLLSQTNAAISDNAMMNDLETVGNAQISTSVKKYGSASMYFDGSGDYLVPTSPSSNVTLGLGSGDFTVEFWVYFIGGLGSDIVLYDGRPLSTNGAYPTIYVNSSSQLSYVVSSADRITSSSAFIIATWYHVAVARSGTSTKMFVNGTQVGSTYTDSTNYLSASRRPVIAINGFNETAAPLNGYIDDLRVTKAARYTGNFTPPTSQVQDQ